MTELDGLEGEYAGAEKIFISGTGFIKKDGRDYREVYGNRR